MEPLGNNELNKNVIPVIPAEELCSSRSHAGGTKLLINLYKAIIKQIIETPNIYFSELFTDSKEITNISNIYI